MTQQIWVLDRGDEALPFCVQTIGKNGSTRLHKWLNHCGFTNSRWDFVCNHDTYKHFPTYVFIQNPIDKFVKGFSEMISNLRPAYAVGAINGLPPQVTASPAAPIPIVGTGTFSVIFLAKSSTTHSTTMAKTPELETALASSNIFFF